MRRLPHRIFWGACAFVLLCPLAGGFADRVWGREVILLKSVHDPEVVEMQKALWELDQGPVPEIYGDPKEEPVRVLSPAGEDLIVPEEDPSLLLLKADPSKGKHPFQVKTLWFGVRWGMAGGLGIAILALAVVGFVELRRR